MIAASKSSLSSSFGSRKPLRHAARRVQRSSLQSCCLVRVASAGSAFPLERLWIEAPPAEQDGLLPLGWSPLSLELRGILGHYSVEQNGLSSATLSRPKSRLAQTHSATG